MDNFFTLGNPLFFILLAMFLLFTIIYVVVKQLIIPMERKHALEKTELALKNEKLVSLFTTLSPDPVFRFDIAGDIVMTNDSGYEATRGTEIIGKSVKTLFPLLSDVDIADFIRQAKEFLADTTIGDQIYHIKIKGIPELAVGHIYCVNITDRKRAETALLAAKEKAEEMDRLKTSFLANMSHELRTPLTGILGYSEALQEDMKDEDDRQFVEIIHSSGMRLLETLNLILDLSKLQAEKMEIVRERVDVVSETMRAASIYKQLAEKKGLTLDISAEKPQIYANLDQRILHQIVTNLVNNAVKYTQFGGVTITVNECKMEGAAGVKISVADTGIGIPKEKQPVIWEEFRQVSEGYGRFFEGTGLGLTVTKNFTEILGGEIQLESDLGKGSTFTVILPCNY